MFPSGIGIYWPYGCCVWIAVLQKLLTLYIQYPMLFTIDGIKHITGLIVDSINSSYDSDSLHIQKEWRRYCVQKRALFSTTKKLIHTFFFFLILPVWKRTSTHASWISSSVLQPRFLNIFTIKKGPKWSLIHNTIISDYTQPKKRYPRLNYLENIVTETNERKHNW